MMKARSWTVRSGPSIVRVLTRSPSSEASALEQLDDEHDDGYHDQDVDEAAERGARHESQQPEHEQYDEYGPKHR